MIKAYEIKGGGVPNLVCDPECGGIVPSKRAEKFYFFLML